MGRYSGKSCRLIFMLSSIGMFFMAELVAGYIGNSISLVSDSFNMLSDVISLSVGLLAARVRRRNYSPRTSYGLVRVEVLGAWSNAVFLFAMRLSVSGQAFKQLAKPEAIDRPGLVLVVGSIGLGLNVIGLLVFQDWRRLCGRSSPRTTATDLESDSPDVEQIEDEGQHLNIRGVLLHMLNDALGSVVVVVTSVLFYIWPLPPDSPCNWQCYMDPSLTLIMVAVIMPSVIPLFRETATILLQIIPRNMPFTKVLDDVCRLPGVLSVHDAHLWELTKSRFVASLHVRVSTELYTSLSGMKMLHDQIRLVLHGIGIHSVTVQLEHGDGRLDKNYCSTPCVTPACLKLSCCPPDVAAHPVYNADLHLLTDNYSKLLKKQEAQSQQNDFHVTKF